MVLGVDPGLTGALAVYNPINTSCAAILDMPLCPKPHSKKKEIALGPLALFFGEWATRIQFAIVEDVGAMPNQGVVSMFRFGEALGIIEGMIGSFFIPIYKAKPAIWKSLMRLSHDKDLSRVKAAEMFPNDIKYFSKAKDDGRAEALLLAVYGAVFLGKRK